MAFDAVLMDTKIKPIIIKDAVFHNTLQLNDDSVRNIKSVRQKSAQDGLAKFAVNLVADDGEMVLCTAKFKKFKTTAGTEALSLASACKFYKSFRIKTVIAVISLLVKEN